MNPLSPPLRRPLKLLRTLRRHVLLHRRSLAALAAGSAVLVGLQAAAPPPPPTVTVWTASHDLAGGEVLDEGDLATAQFSPETVPSGAVRNAREAVGHTLTAPMLRGEAMTRVHTLARGLLRGYPGSTAVPLRITDAAVVDLLRVGDRMSFVVADPDGRRAPEPLVRDVPVVAVPEVREGALGTGTPGRLVVVAVPSTRATEIAGAAASAILIPVWNR